MEDVRDWIKREKIIAIIRGVAPTVVLDTAEAIKKGGISCLEITIDHRAETNIQNTYKMLRLLRQEMGSELCIGAGSVLTTEEVERCAEAGATYIISPNVNCSVIRKTKELGLVSIPGALTPSEVVLAHEAGADIVKLFPIGILGVSYVKALRAPLKHIDMAAVGNVTLQNGRTFLEAGCCCLGVGGCLVDHREIEKGNFGEIAQLARSFVQNVR